MCWRLRAETTPESGACPPRTVPRRGRRARERLADANHMLCAGRLCVLAGNVDAPLPRRLHRGFVTLLITRQPGEPTNGRGKFRGDEGARTLLIRKSLVRAQRGALITTRSSATPPRRPPADLCHPLALSPAIADKANEGGARQEEGGGFGHGLKNTADLPASEVHRVDVQIGLCVLDSRL
jgi:hypothetical protein